MPRRSHAHPRVDALGPSNLVEAARGGGASRCPSAGAGRSVTLDLTSVTLLSRSSPRQYPLVHRCRPGAATGVVSQPLSLGRRPGGAVLQQMWRVLTSSGASSKKFGERRGAPLSGSGVRACRRLHGANPPRTATRRICPRGAACAEAIRGSRARLRAYCMHHASARASTGNSIEFPRTCEDNLLIHQIRSLDGLATEQPVSALPRGAAGVGGTVRFT